MGFVIECMQRFKVVERHVSKVEEEYSDAEDVLEGSDTNFVLIGILKDEARIYVLKNKGAIQP